MKIEGLRVLSANTDGILIHHPRDTMDQVDAAPRRVRAIYELNKFDVVEVLRLCRVNIHEYG